MNTDVIVVGGGPAGSSVAYGLAQQGFGACILEKYAMPRYKTCGGGVNVRAAKLFPFTIDPVVERVIHRYRFTFRGTRPFEREYPQPLTYMTQRARLDKYLVDQAIAAGATFRSGVTVRKVTVGSDSVSVITDQGEELKARVVIGADGANSVVSRELGLMRDVRHELALESEVALTPKEMERWQDTIEIDLFSVFCGYGWVFPKAEHISIGVGGLREQVKQLKAYNSQYLERHNVAERTPLRFSGHALPVRAGTSAVIQGRGLLVGDAAGLLEPFTGEGIGYAVKSGQLASDAVGAFLRGEVDSLTGYSDRLDREISPDLIDAQRYVRLFNRFPKLFYRLLQDRDTVWNAVCLVLRGERSFADVNHRLGVFRHVVSILS